MLEYPIGYIPISIAATKLKRSMFGNLKRTEPIIKIKKREPRLSVNFGPQRLQASDQIRKAARAGELPIYAILAGLHEPQIVYPEILACIICVRGVLPDYIGRNASFKKLVPANKALYFGIRDGLLVINEREFERWRAAKYKEGKWPSQRLKKRIKRNPGRPRLADDDLRIHVIACLRDGSWTARAGIPALRKLLSSFGIKVPSEDTLRRIVRALYIETGEAELQVNSRRPRRATKAQALPQK
jgi:hypothetical protein